MILRTRCHLQFQLKGPTPFVFMLRPQSGALQWIMRDQFDLRPNVGAYEFSDGYGNLCQRVMAPAGAFSITTSADVMTSDESDRGYGEPFIEIQNLPDSVMSFILPSRFCESDRFFDMAMSIAGTARPGYDQVAAIEAWLRDTIRYMPGTSAIPSSAIEINQAGSGVCRDLSHLGIALCRSISIPARLVVGYLHELEPMDMHAWFEAFVGGRWYTFDAVQTELSGGYVPLGYGRDAADVALYTQFGPLVQSAQQEVTVERLS
ncbi:MAG: transglutaminase family protein [Gammaproteobacteria bacterium]|nr:transglutaminase family protein [Gammaproteobacteria bacterium]